ncbi:MAG: DUF305 domain-containing protein [Acidothermales bacterium]|jgi:uncharacterized protein (DUF305 family)|nr:DUF305 domain-containing protein [Acidothermales bacterium]
MKHSRTRALTSTLTVLAVALTLASCSGGGAAADHNDADVMFATMMIPHHAQAVEMSEAVLAKDGVDEGVVDLAERVKDAQQPEIDQMTGWLETWGEDVPAMSGAHSAHGGMPGMMSAEQMKALADAPGEQASPLFLQRMTEHHQGAIDMAKEQVADGENAEAVDLAERIAADQQEEIEEMQELLTKL